MASPHSYEDTMRQHDVAFYNWLGGLEVDYGSLGGAAKPNFPILRVFASPMRAYASLVDLLVEQGFVSGADAEKMRERADQDFGVLPLPLATIERDEPALDPELPGSPTKALRTFEWDPAVGAYVAHPFPAHYRTDYRVTLWCIKRYTDAFMREWVYAQLGNRGAAENECFITVEHEEPWGSMQQALKFTGSSNLSDLEGDSARYLRHEFTFSLRTWLMKATSDGGYPVEAVETDKYELVGDDGVLLEEQTRQQSANLFWVPIPTTKVPTLWPKEGDAEVTYSTEFPLDVMNRIPFTFKITVEDQADKVLLVERPTTVDAQGVDLFGISFQYLLPDDPVELEIVQRDLILDTLSSADSLILPPTSAWKKVHRFSLVDDGSYYARIAGITASNPQVVRVSDVDLRRIYAQTKVAPTDQVDEGASIKYRWFSLARVPYLCIIAITTTVGGLNTVTVDDDAGSPGYTAQRGIDSSVNVGAVFLVQPKTTSLALHVPKTTTLAAVYVQKYTGWYDGHEV